MGLCSKGNFDAAWLGVWQLQQLGSIKCDGDVHKSPQGVYKADISIVSPLPAQIETSEGL